MCTRSKVRRRSRGNRGSAWVASMISGDRAANVQPRFVLPATHVEALYAPEVFADAPNVAVDVRAH